MACKDISLMQGLIDQYGADRFTLAFDININKLPIVALHGWVDSSDMSLWTMLNYYKKHVEDTIDNRFVRKDMCNILHETTAKELSKSSDIVIGKLDIIVKEISDVQITLATSIKQIEVNTKRLDILEGKP